MGDWKKLGRVPTVVSVVLIPIRVFIIFRIRLDVLGEQLGTYGLRDDFRKQEAEVFRFLA